jgi:hypothetical protein
VSFQPQPGLDEAFQKPVRTSTRRIPSELPVFTVLRAAVPPKESVAFTGTARGPDGRTSLQVQAPSAVLPLRVPRFPLDTARLNAASALRRRLGAICRGAAVLGAPSHPWQAEDSGQPRVHPQTRGVNFGAELLKRAPLRVGCCKGGVAGRTELLGPVRAAPKADDDALDLGSGGGGGGGNGGHSGLRGSYGIVMRRRDHRAPARSSLGKLWVGRTAGT